MIKAYLPPENPYTPFPGPLPAAPNHPARTSPSDGRPPCPYPPPKPPPKPGDFTRFKTSRPGQGTLPGTNIDRE